MSVFSLQIYNTDWSKGNGEQGIMFYRQAMIVCLTGVDCVKSIATAADSHLYF